MSISVSNTLSNYLTGHIYNLIVTAVCLLVILICYIGLKKRREFNAKDPEYQERMEEYRAAACRKAQEDRDLDDYVSQMNESQFGDRQFYQGDDSWDSSQTHYKNPEDE